MIILLVIIASFPAQAQDKGAKNSVMFQWGGESAVSRSMDSGFESGPYGDLYDMYEKRFQEQKGGSVIALALFHNFAKRLSVGVYAAYSHASGDYYDPVEDKVLYRKKARGCYLVPQARFIWMDGYVLKLFSGAGYGVGRETSKHDKDAQPVITKSVWSVVPVGAHFIFADISWDIEVEVGSVMSGVKIGIGYNF